MGAILSAGGLAKGKLISASFQVTLTFFPPYSPRKLQNLFLYFSVLFFVILRQRNFLCWELSGLQYYFNVYLSNFQRTVNK